MLHLLRTQSSNGLPLKPGVGQYIAMHATLTSRALFLYSHSLASFHLLCCRLVSSDVSLVSTVFVLSRLVPLWGAANAESHLMRTQSLKVLPLKPGVGQYIAMHATLTARNFSLLISPLPVHSPAFF